MDVVNVNLRNTEVRFSDSIIFRAAAYKLGWRWFEETFRQGYAHPEHSRVSSATKACEVSGVRNVEEARAIILKDPS